MNVETEGIVLKQVKTANGRKIITLLSRNYGKLSAGSGYTKKGKAALATRPFTKARYLLYKGRASYNVEKADVIKSYYGIGEDVDKYIRGAYALELMDRLIEEGQPVPGVFDLLDEFFRLLEKRKGEQDTLLLAFRMKLLDKLGYCPDMNVEKDDEPLVFNVADGRFEKAEKIQENQGSRENSQLILRAGFDIVSVLRYFVRNPMQRLEKLTLEDDVRERAERILKAYIKYHLDIDKLKSEEMLQAGD